MVPSSHLTPKSAVVAVRGAGELGAAKPRRHRVAVAALEPRLVERRLPNKEGGLRGERVQGCQRRKVAASEERSGLPKKAQRELPRREAVRASFAMSPASSSKPPPASRFAAMRLRLAGPPDDDAELLAVLPARLEGVVEAVAGLHRAAARRRRGDAGGAARQLRRGGRERRWPDTAAAAAMRAGSGRLRP